MDVGSGGGAPGLPLAAALPDREVTLLEANGRKAAFLERVAAEFPNVRVVRGRAEEHDSGHLRRCGRKGARAPAGRRRALPPARPYRRGRCPLCRARRRMPTRSASSAGKLGGGPIELHPGLLVVPKVAPTPPGFPRRAGDGVETSAGVTRIHPMPATIYAVANQKGGVGKTTTAVNLAACLAEAGERALIVDLDPQANATSGLGARANGTSTYDLLDGAPLARLAKETAFPGLHLVPSRPELAGAAVELAGPRGRRDVPARGAGSRPRGVRLRLPRLPALARPADRQRARRRRPRARPGAGGVLRARGACPSWCARSS